MEEDRKLFMQGRLCEEVPSPTKIILKSSGGGAEVKDNTINYMDGIIINFSPTINIVGGKYKDPEEIKSLRQQINETLHESFEKFKAIIIGMNKSL